MANTLLVDSNLKEWNQRNTQFNGVIGDGFGALFDSSNTTVDDLVLSSGTLSNFWINIVTNTNTNSTTLTFNKNHADGNETISVPANTTGTFTDAVHTDSIAVNDVMDLKITFGTSTISFQPSIFAFTYAADTDTVTKILSSDHLTTNNTSNNVYFRTVFSNALGSSAVTEANAKNRQRKAGTYKNCGVKVFSNSNANATTWRSRKNGANGNISISIPAGTTGNLSDVTHSDSVSPDDDYCYSHTTGASTVSIEVDWATIDFVSTNQDSIHTSAYDAGTSLNTSVTRFWALSGDLNNPLTTESNSQVLVNSAYTFSELTINIQSPNNITNASTLTLRANGSDVISLSIPASSSGVFSNSTDTYTAASSDLMNYKLVTAATGTSMTINHISVWSNLTPPAPSGPTGFPRSFKNLIRRAMDWKLHTFGNGPPTFGGV